MKKTLFNFVRLNILYVQTIFICVNNQKSKPTNLNKQKIHKH